METININTIENINLNDCQRFSFRRLKKGSRTKLYNSFTFLNGKIYKVFAPSFHYLNFVNKTELSNYLEEKNLKLCKGIFGKESFLLTTSK
jgi:hypothetical protein